MVLSGNQCTALSHLSKPNNEYPTVDYGYLLCILLAVLLMKILILGVYSLDMKDPWMRWADVWMGGVYSLDRISG